MCHVYALQSVTTRPNASQPVTTPRSSSQLVTAGRNLPQHVTTHHNASQLYATRHNLSQLFSARHNSLHLVSVCHNASQHFTICHNTSQHVTTRPQLVTARHNGSQSGVSSYSCSRCVKWVTCSPLFTSPGAKTSPGKHSTWFVQCTRMPYKATQCNLACCIVSLI